MRHRLHWTLCVATALGSVLAAPAALAQVETDTAQDVNPADQALAADAAPPAGTIIVTARRFEERLQDVPISITVFNQEQLNQRNIVNPSDLATYTPSLSVNRQFGTEKATFSIRGFTQELVTQPSVAVYFADVVAPRAQGPTTSGNGTFPGTLFDLQNVQILKGPQGTLFGRNTTGGAVLLVPQKPRDRFEGYVEGTVGNFEARRVQAVVNSPLAEGVRLRLGVDRMLRDGYLKNRSGIGPADFADIDYWSARGSLVIDLADNLENYTIATYNHSDTNGHLPRLVACARDPALRGRVRGSASQALLGGPACAQLDRQRARGDSYFDVENNVADPQVRLEQWQVINTTAWDVSDTLTIRNIASYGEFRERTRINLGGDNFAFGSQPFAVVRIEPGPSGDQAAQWTFTEELQFQGRTTDERLTWQAGGYAEISRPLESNTQFSPILLNCTDAAALQCTDVIAAALQGLPPAVRPFAVGQLSLIDQRYRFRNLAAYAQATYDITDQISLTGGIRYTSDRTKARAQNVTTFFPPSLGGVPVVTCSDTRRPIASIAARAACREELVEKSSKPTWLLNLDYKPNDDILLYAKYARGYRQGVVNLLPRSVAVSLTGPEKVDTYEVGAKVSFTGAVRGNFNIAAFYNDFSNQQLQANAFEADGRSFTNILVNAGKSRIQGVEVDASVSPFEGLRLDLAYAYLDTKLKSIAQTELVDPLGVYVTILPTAVEGGPLVYSPKNKVTMSANYTLPIPERYGELSVGATFTHTDRQFASRSTVPYLANGQLTSDPARLPATDLLNLNLNWNNVNGMPVDVSLFATNVTNEKYHVSLTNFFGFGYESIIIGEPRVYGVRTRFRFGG